MSLSAWILLASAGLMYVVAGEDEGERERGIGWGRNKAQGERSAKRERKGSREGALWFGMNLNSRK